MGSPWHPLATHHDANHDPESDSNGTVITIYRP